MIINVLNAKLKKLEKVERTRMKKVYDAQI